MSELFKRLGAETSDFFKKVTSFFVVLGAIGTALTAAQDMLPSWVGTVSPYLILAGIVGAAVAQTTVKDPSKL